jgi:4'-phosphopantetheinyl transferase
MRVSAAPRLDLAAHDAHIWIARSETLTAAHDALSATLSQAECRRLAGYRRPVDRFRRTLGRGALRTLVGRYLGARPADVEIDQTCACCNGAHGPLRIAGLSASIAYAPAATAIAIARSPVGVDLEPMPPRVGWRRVADVLPEDEKAALARLPEADRPTAAITAWTALEALMKGLGCGLAVTGADVRHANAQPGWTVHPLREIPGHVAAVAVGARAMLVGPLELTTEMIL